MRRCLNQGISPDDYHHDQRPPAPNGSTKPNWNRQAADSTSPSDALERMNERYCVVCDGGKTRVLSFESVVQKDHTRLGPDLPDLPGFPKFLHQQNRQTAGQKGYTIRTLVAEAPRAPAIRWA